MSGKSILIADDHAIVRDGLKMLLARAQEFTLVGEASNGCEVMERIREHEWDIVLLDISMPGRSGLDLIKQIRAARPLTPVLVLTMHQERQYAVRALRAGASGYTTKENDAAHLLGAIRKVMAGGVYLGPAMDEHLVRSLLRAMQAARGDAPLHERLSDREYQVFQALVAGNGVSGIASRMNLSVKTVSTHKTRLMDKLGMDNIPALVRYAMEYDLLDQRSDTSA